MATRSDLENLIETNLGDLSNITAEEHREVENAFVNEFFSDIVLDGNGLPVNIFQSMTPNLTYRVNTKKIGNIVFVQGYFLKTQTEGSIGISESIFQIVDSAYIPKSGATIVKAYPNNIGYSDMTLSVHNNGAITNSSGTAVVISQPRNFNFFYFVND